jgi:hypothetical protein
MAADASNQAKRAASADMEDIAQEVQLLSEKTLQDIVKGPLVKFTLTSQDIE